MANTTRSENSLSADVPQTTFPGLKTIRAGRARDLTARISSISIGALVAHELVALQLADAVLGADAAAEPRDEVVDDAVGAGAFAMNASRRRPRARRQVVVQVAVAQVAEDRRTHARATPRRALPRASPETPGSPIRAARCRA